jgi:enamine deaminase RidA (YjgF/YER057c/UK114 family)
MRSLISSGSPWESKIGYSRAVVVDNTIYISASAATGEDGTVVSPDLYEQTRYILAKLETVLEDAGFTMAEVVSSRLSVSDFDNWSEATRAHGEVFADIRPAFAIVHALPFIDPEILVEVELIAVHSRD